MKRNNKTVFSIMRNNAEISTVIQNNNILHGREIYGVSWDGGSNPVLTRTDDAVGMVANEGLKVKEVKKIKAK